MTDYLFTVFDYSPDWQALLRRPEFVWAVPALLLVLALWLLYPWVRRRRDERRVRANLRRMGKSALGDVTLDNGMEGFVFIDYLVLTPAEILVVTLMNTRGIIFGGEKIDSWARVVGRRTFKFPNPIAASQERVLAVKYHVPAAQVRGVVLFGAGCSFPKGKPDGVLQPQEISTDAEHWENVQIPPALQAAWDKLAETARLGFETYGHDVMLLRGTESHLRELIALVLGLVALAWSGWHLLA
jgi:hypothetical protein